MIIAIRKGVGFGLTSGIITTLGLVLGLHSSNAPLFVILGGVITIAIADAFSDSLGVHISEESGSKNTKEKNIWKSTISTFFTKFFIALSFLIPLTMFNIDTAIIISIIWGLLLITLFSYYIAKINNHSVINAMFEHLFIAVLVIVITMNIGYVIDYFFGS